MQLLREKAEKMPMNGERTYRDMQLVGKFRGADLQLDDEGSPQHGTGIYISSAYYDKGKLTVAPPQDLQVPRKATQNIFIQVAADGQSLHHLNDRLQPVPAGPPFLDYAPMHFRDALDNSLLLPLKAQLHFPAHRPRLFGDDSSDRQGHKI
jgi:hypothetical protein